MEYGDESELDRYVRRNFIHLLHEDELELYRDMLLKEKIEPASTGDVQEQLRKQLAHGIHRLSKGEAIEGIALLFGDLAQEHKKRIDPLIQELKQKLVPNRCPKCNKIVRTPEARQCLWCGADWH